MRTLWALIRDGWNRFWFAPQSTAPVELLRIVFGMLATAWMISLTPVLGPFFGAVAAVPKRELPTGGWTLLTLVHGTPLIWVLWLSGLLGALSLIVGFRTRLAALLAFVTVLSVTREAPLAFNAGDGLIRLLALYVLLMPAGSAVSVDRWRADRHGWCSFPRRAPWALRLAQVQLSVIYLATVGEKSGGVLWQDGSAVSYALRIGELNRVPVPPFLTESLLLSQLATYGTVATELAIAVLVWNRVARPWVLALGVLLHVSIEITLAVGFFGVAVITLYLAFVPPDRAERVLLWGRGRLRRHRSVLATGPAAPSVPEVRKPRHVPSREPVPKGPDGSGAFKHLS
ncbi:HTTM domain-containing protein [Actinomycetospora lutea]|uniref:HTTM domain-containing protein n=1 Tax=Actinomycetospora lutea TaxID=663604 RepID=UPI002365EDE3|nr:HTTM domain-containing protein [Actinomycetospora lutea]MDD7942281.1 HTTM domain-containing protein [Actinomycetospora lutea]